MQSPGRMVKRLTISIWTALIPLYFLVYLFLAVGCQSKNDSRPAASLKEDSLPRFGRITKTPDQLVRNALIRLAPQFPGGETPARPAVCAFGSPEADGFTPTMGCELVAFIARVVERTAERWPILN